MNANKYQAHIYLIRTLSNLHMGGGDSNFDYIDKQVQRDPATNYPTMFASGIKGSLREYMREMNFSPIMEMEVFGSEPDNSNNVQGKYRFISADLLALPRPATDVNATSAYDIVSTDSILSSFKGKAKLMGKSEDISLDFPTAIIATSEFKTLAEELPILARNHLDNGISQNLWYEEVVPRESYLGFVLLTPQGDLNFKSFNELIDQKVIQIGANATVGYGLCHFEKL